MDLIDACALHQLTLSADGRTAATQRQYLTYEKRFLEFLNTRGIPPTLDALNPLNVRLATEWFRKDRAVGSRGGQVATQTFVDTLKLWANFLEREGVWETSPLTRVKRVRVAKVLRQPFTQTEIQALWAASRQTRYSIRDEALLLLLLDTGMRIGEAMTLTLDKLHLDERHIVVGLEGKGRAERLVPIGDPTKRDGGHLLHALRAWLRARPASPTPRLFVDRRGFAISSEGGSEIFQRIGAIAGVTNSIPHRCRHSMATHYLTVHPGDVIGLRRIIGHTSDAVTQDYIHLSQTTIADRAGRASLVESLSTPKVPPPVPSLSSARVPIGVAWGAQSPDPAPPMAPSPTEPTPAHGSIAALLVGLDVDERRALLKALLRTDSQ
jgi:site-specific recombinase XerD